MNNPPLNQQGIRLPSGTRVTEKPHASRGGNAYSQEIREQVITMFQSGGEAALRSHHLMPLRQQKKFPHFVTCMRWVTQFQSDGHALPKQPTGNHRAQREIKGQDLFNLALFRAIRPKAYIDECHAYIHNRNPAVLPYSPSQVVRAEQRLGLWLKAASTTSDCDELINLTDIIIGNIDSYHDYFFMSASVGSRINNMK